MRNYNDKTQKEAAQEKVLNWLKANPDSIVDEMATAMNINRSTVGEYMRVLLLSEKAVRSGMRGKAIEWRAVDTEANKFSSRGMLSRLWVA